jgi:hypothetical protein
MSEKHPIETPNKTLHDMDKQMLLSNDSPYGVAQNEQAS